MFVSFRSCVQFQFLLTTIVLLKAATITIPLNDTNYVVNGKKHLLSISIFVLSFSVHRDLVPGICLRGDVNLYDN